LNRITIKSALALGASLGALLGASAAFAQDNLAATAAPSDAGVDNDPRIIGLSVSGKF